MKEIYLNSQVCAAPSDTHAARTRWTPPFTQKFETEEAQHSLRKLVEAEEEVDFILTSSGAESVNHAVLSAYLDITRKTGKNHYIATNHAEISAIAAMNRLKEMGCVFQMAPDNEKGIVDRHIISETITPRTAMLSLSWANGSTGVIQPIAEISALCRDRGILFHVDATHVLGKGHFTFADSGADVLTCDGPPLHAPEGTGGLWIRKGLKLSPFIMGRKLHLENLKALGKAAHQALHFRDHLCTEVARLRNYFEEELMKKCPSASIVGENEERVPHISCILFPGVLQEALLFWLAREKVYATNTVGAQCSLSFGFSRDTQEEEIHIAIEKIVKGVNQLQKYSKWLRYEL